MKALDLTFPTKQAAFEYAEFHGCMVFSDGTAQYLTKRFKLKKKGFVYQWTLVST